MFYFDDEDNNQKEEELEENEVVEDEKEKEDLSNSDEDKNDESDVNDSDEFSDYDEKDEYESKENDYNQVDRYYENMKRERENEEYGNKKSNNSYVSKKTVALIVSICLVIAIICGICVGVLSSSMRERLLASQTTSTVETSVETIDKQQTSTKSVNQSTEKPIETAENIPTTITGDIITLKTNDVGGTALSVKDVYKKVNASVVIIKTNSGAGSGVVVTQDGYIITNYHVANSSDTAIEVSFSDGSIYSATYILGDENSDVALLKTAKTNCVPAEIANSSQMEIGDVAVVIGNALGRGITLTSGYISALSRTISVDGITMTLLQTDATINSGNSGGGLFNEYGQLVALVNSKTGGSTVEGTGYAIPMNDVVKVISDLQTHGYITGKARLGITMNVIGSSFSSYGYIVVKEINENGSVANSGLQVNDILYKLDGTTITSTTVLSDTLSRCNVGDTVKLIVLRPTKDLSEFKVQSWFTGTITYDYDSYVASCETVELEVTFIEFNPNN